MAPRIGSGLALIGTLLLGLISNPAFAMPREPARTAVISAFEPEWARLKRKLAHAHRRSLNGVEFITGTLEGRPVVLFLSGVSMVNAAMTTQLALDHFNIDRIVFSGIAGGVDPALHVGDVVVPAHWAQYLESSFARADGAAFAPPPFPEYSSSIPHYGMIYPHAPSVQRAGAAAPERKAWFDADSEMLALARRIAPTVALRKCIEAACLDNEPRVQVGGAGVSASVFMDNAEMRRYLFKAFDAQAVDMETAAMAQVAFANGKPFIAFRSLSDLAGGDAGANQMQTFFKLASENASTVVEAFLAALPEAVGKEPKPKG